MRELTNHDDLAKSENDSMRHHSSLDLPDEIWCEFVTNAQTFVTEYLAHVSELPIFPETTKTRFSGSLLSKLPEQGATVDEILEECREISAGSRHTGHPRYFGYVASSASPVGVIADFVASALNQNLTAWRSSPSAVDIERMVVGWLGSMVGFGDVSCGLLTSGGSMANLNAIYIAHRSKAPQSSMEGLWNVGKPMTIYVSDQAHLSIAKAADILGLGRQHVRVVRTDDRFRLDVRDLRERLESDSRNGLRPFCVVASAGTVNTGAVDPLGETAALAHQHDLWFHIDGAYGAFGAAVRERRHLFAGLELADSVSLDPHKWLYAPIDCGCLLLRDAAMARAPFSHGGADYIKVYEESDREAFAFWDYGIELTRRFRALKVWMILRYHGSRKIAKTISEDILLAKYLGECIEESQDFELLAPVELSICCFHYVPADVRAKLEKANDEERATINNALDRMNEKLMNAVQRGGRAYLSNAVLNGRFALRVCIVNFRTTREDLEMTLDILRDAASGIEI